MYVGIGQRSLANHAYRLQVYMQKEATSEFAKEAAVGIAANYARMVGQDEVLCVTSICSGAVYDRGGSLAVAFSSSQNHWRNCPMVFGVDHRKSRLVQVVEHGDNCSCGR